MTATLARHGWTALPLSLMVFVLGCATASRVQLTSWQPAQADVRNVRRVCVLPFAGPQGAGDLVHQTITALLLENGYYQLADPAMLQQYVSAPLYRDDGVINAPVALDAAERMRLDAILVGRVRYQQESAMIQIGDPTVRAVVQYELIDVRNRRTLAQGDAAETYTGELTQSKIDSNSESRVFARLAKAGAEEVARRITPHQRSFEVELASASFGTGTAALRDGNGLAEQGDWDGAVQQWQATLAADPESDEAMYNLGLASEIRGDFAQAQSLFTAAIRIDNKDAYRLALDRVTEAAPRHQLAVAQLHRLDGSMPASYQQPLAQPLPVRTAGPLGQEPQSAPSGPSSTARRENNRWDSAPYPGSLR